MSLAQAADDALEAARPAVHGMLALLIAATVWLACDREPPFELVRPDYPPPVARPGDHVALRATVNRQTDRGCSVEMERRVLFADGRRIDMAPGKYTAQEVAMSEVRSPGRMAPVIDVPTWAPLGRADVVSTLRYRCNITHDLYPITVVTNLPFEVVP